jgi:trigger factor
VKEPTLSTIPEEEGAELTEQEAPPARLAVEAEIQDSGPCKKRVRVRVPRTDIERYYDAEVGELTTSAAVPGFRVGHVPRRLVERRFRKELSDQVKQKLLVESLEQVAEEHKLDPINEPDLDVLAIELPEEGDFEYEFDVEVRPDFELPDYEGLTVERPVRRVTDADIDEYMRRFLSQYGHLDPRDAPAEPGDFVVVSVEFRHNDRPVRKMHDLTVRLRPVLRFQDGEIQGFDELMSGVSADDVREADVRISDEAESLELRGETVHARFTVHAVKRMHTPELTKDFLTRLGVESEDELRDEIRDILQRQVTYSQRQAVRQQVLEKITESADWDLPEGTVRRQVENALRREILEMQQAGFTNQDIQARENELRQRAVSTTRQALKEHFVLDKIATREGIEVGPAEIDAEIRMMAVQQGESPRRVRARLEKSGLIENLEAQVRERMAVDFILQRAKFVEKDVTPEQRDRVEAVSRSICGPAAVSAGTAAEEEEAGE